MSSGFRTQAREVRSLIMPRHFAKFSRTCPPETQFSFVGHSMGNIVVRHLISDLQRDGDPHGVLDRCRSMVMLGPPNQGAAIARRLAPTGLYGILTGKGGLELGPDWEDFVQNLATPSFPFAIIAGDVSATRH